MSSNIGNLLFETCIGHIDDVALAQKYEIKRIELNCALNLGGLTPSLAMVKQARALYSGKIIVMIRCRPGGFTYSHKEMAVHFQDIEIFRPYVDGYAFGCLRDNGEIATELLGQIREITQGKELAFHRAFDLVTDCDKAMQELIICGVDRVLSGGLKKLAQDGWQNLRHLQQKYGQSIVILAGGGVKANNILDLAEKTGIKEFHASLLTMKYNRDSKADLSYATQDENNHYEGLDESQLREMLNEISGHVV